MKIHRLASLIVGALAVPAAAYAADAATIFSLKGQVKVRKGEVDSLAVVGSEFSDGMLAQSGAGASVGLKLPDASTLFLGPDSTARLRFTGKGKGTEVILLKGSVAGNFSEGNVLVRSAAGLADFSGSGARAGFSPGVNGGGVMTVEVVTGISRVTPLGAGRSVSVPAGNRIRFGTGVSGEPAALDRDAVEVVSAATTGVFVIVKEGKPAPVTPPVASGAVGTNAQKHVPDLAVLSPNGEGSTN